MSRQKLEAKTPGVRYTEVIYITTSKYLMTVIKSVPKHLLSGGLTDHRLHVTPLLLYHSLPPLSAPT